ncbi:MAG: diguanylate cyclase domain-containing protein [Halodesulfovibrio sp.]
MRSLPGLSIDDRPEQIAAALRSCGTFFLPLNRGDGELVAVGAGELIDCLQTGRDAVLPDNCASVVRVEGSWRIGDHVSLEALRTDQVYVIEEQGVPFGFVTAYELLLSVAGEVAGRVGERVDPTRHILLGLWETVYHAHKSLFETQKRVVLVTAQNSHPVGLLTDRDISSLIDKGCDIWSTRLGDVALPLDMIGTDDSMENACARFLATGSQCMAVVGEDGDIPGLLWRQDALPDLSSRSGGDGHCGIPPTRGASRAQQAEYLESLLSSSFKNAIIGTDEFLSVMYFNSAAQSLLPDQKPLCLGSPVWSVTDACNISRDEFKNALSGTRDGAERVIASWRVEGGVKRYLQCRVNRVSNITHLAGYVLTIHDVTSQRNAEAAILRLAYYDRLTQLPNRQLFEERLEQEVRRCKRGGLKFAVMMIDLDGFKKVNDSLGHLLGDELLRQVGGRLNANVRESDTVARFGGDEFIFLLPEVEDYEAALSIAVKMQQIVSAPYLIEGMKITVMGSVGVAMYPDDAVGGNELLRIADARMFTNKRTGELVTSLMDD